MYPDIIILWPLSTYNMDYCKTVRLRPKYILLGTGTLRVRVPYYGHDLGMLRA